MSERSKHVILKELENVTKKLATDKDRVVEKVGDIMRGEYKKPQYLVEYDEAKEAIEKAKAKGEAKGEAKGKAERDRLKAEVDRLRKENEELKKKYAMV